MGGGGGGGLHPTPGRPPWTVSPNEWSVINAFIVLDSDRLAAGSVSGCDSVFGRLLRRQCLLLGLPFTVEFDAFHDPVYGQPGSGTGLFHAGQRLTGKTPEADLVAGDQQAAQKLDSSTGGPLILRRRGGSGRSSDEAGLTIVWPIAFDDVASRHRREYGVAAGPSRWAASGVSLCLKTQRSVGVIRVGRAHPQRFGTSRRRTLTRSMPESPLGSNHPGGLGLFLVPWGIVFGGRLGHGPTEFGSRVDAKLAVDAGQVGLHCFGADK